MEADEAIQRIRVMFSECSDCTTYYPKDCKKCREAKDMAIMAIKRVYAEDIKNE